MSIEKLCGARRFLSATLAVASLVFFTGQSEAANISASSSGYGLFVDVNALNLVNLDVGPLPTGISGVAPAPYSTPATVLNVSTSASIPLVASASVTAGVVSALAASDVDGGLGSRTTSASGGVIDFGLDVVTLPILPPGLQLLSVDSTLSSTAQVSGDFGSLVASGSTVIQSLDLVISGIPVDLSAFLNVAIAPNTSVNLALLGIANASLVLNEQIVAGDQSSIMVNAFHLNVNLANSIVAEVVLGHSQAQMTAVASGVPEPTTGVMALGAITSFGALTRRRRWLAGV